MNDFRPRTVSSQLRGQAGLDDQVHGWSDWTPSGFSPDRPGSSSQPFVDHYDLGMGEVQFSDFSATRAAQGSFPPGLGFEVSMGMAGIDEEPHSAVEQPAELGNEVQTAAGSSAAFSLEQLHQHQLPADPLHAHFLPLLAGTQPYPGPSSASSPARSRASSLHSIAPPNLHMSALTSPASPFFPNPLPSPFHDHPGSFTSSTINPAHSVRSSSPSETGSVSNLNMSRIESSSQGSSVYGGEASTAPSTPYRSNSISSRGTGSERQSHQKHLRRRSSPIKGTRHTRKLSNADRKAICIFHITHPGLKQDDIGAHFGYERSTISKTLKFKDKYLAMDSDDETSSTAIVRAAANQRRAQYGASVSDEPQQYPDYSSSNGQHHLAPSSSVSSLVSLDSHASADSFGAASQPPQQIVGGRFPLIDNALAAWCRDQVPLGQPLADSAMQQQAREIAALLGSSNFKASATWLEGFKQRAGISGGTFLDLLRRPGTATTAPTPTLTSAPRWLNPPKEEEDEEDAGAQQDDDGDEEYDLPNTRRSKRRLGAKTVRRLTSAKSALASFADGVMGSRSSTPGANRTLASNELDYNSPFQGGSFGDLSMDADATPTHTTVHSRASTSTTERPNGLAQPFSYSPTGASETGSIVTATPSRTNQHGPLPLMLSGSGASDYSPPTEGPYGVYLGTNDLPGLNNSSSSSSLANFDGSSSLAPSCLDPTASPAHPPSYRHGRSGSTASTNSVYSGLTAFSSQSHSQGSGTPLTGSLYGSFRDSQSNLCSVPGSPANGSAACFGNELQQQQQQQQQQIPFPSSSLPQYSHTQVSSSSSQHQQHPSHQRYPGSASSPAYPGTPSQHQQQQQQQQQHIQQQQQGSGGRRNTISGGAPFSGRGSSAMSSSLSSQSQLPASAAPSPTPSPSPFGRRQSSHAPSHSLSLSASPSSHSLSSSALGHSQHSSLSASTSTLAASASASSTQTQTPNNLGGHLSLEQAFSHLELALGYLESRASGEGVKVSPKDWLVLQEVKGKMERASLSRSQMGGGGVSMAAISSAPPTPSGLGFSVSTSSSGAAYFPQQPLQQSPFQAPIAAFASPSKPSAANPAQRLRLARTQSTSAVPSFGGMSGGGGSGLGLGSSGALERGVMGSSAAAARRSGKGRLG
ncbi:hypothetical protein JCM8547_007266 [Rhodosporidiobolus lusitaniae]